MCLPIADAFHAKYEPDGSIWKRVVRVVRW